MIMLFQPDPNLVAEHRRWLSAFNSQYLCNWEKLLNGDPEAAMCEAAVRRLLEENGNAVRPNEDLDGSGRAPDFRCTQAGKTFYAEVTSISIGKVTERTKLPHYAREWPGGAVGSLVRDVFAACCAKAQQCANLDHPSLVAVGTFHQTASWVLFDKREAEMLLEGPSFYTFTVDTQTGESLGDGRFAIDLRPAAFLRPRDSEIDHARRSISALLICGFGWASANAQGILHPLAARPFDRTMLPKIGFCRLQDGYELGIFKTEWI
jgi:hypothetical protein